MLLHWWFDSYFQLDIKHMWHDLGYCAFAVFILNTGWLVCSKHLVKNIQNHNSGHFDHLKVGLYYFLHIQILIKIINTQRQLCTSKTTKIIFKQFRLGINGSNMGIQMIAALSLPLHLPSDYVTMLCNISSVN